jgi:hypothetical protein
VAAAGPLSQAEALVQLEQLLSAMRARGELAILVLDQAQTLDRELLAEIRLLSELEVQGEKLLQIILVGQPELEVKLAQPELRQLRQQIGVHYRMLPLSATETAHYIHHRIAVAGGSAHELFPTDTCIEVFRITNGIPREINIVAGQALLNASNAHSRTASQEHVRAVEREIESQSIRRDRAQTARPAAPPPPEAPVVEAFTEPKRAMEPEPFAAEIPPLTPPSPGVRPEPEPAPVPEPAASAVTPPSARATAAQANVPILPSWFDEVVARHKRMELEDAAAGSAPATAPSASAPARTARRLADPAWVPDRPAAPLDPLWPRPHAKRAGDEEQAPTKRAGFDWPVAATLVAAVVIGTLLLVRFGPWTLPRQTPAPAPAIVPPTAPPPVPSAQATPPAKTSGGTAPQKQAIVPRAPAPATASTLKPADRPAATGAATVVPQPSASPPVAKGPAIATVRFGIAVGAYLNEDRAIAERTRLTESTRLPSRVVTVAEDSVPMYRVVMGSFANRVSAERAASDLVRGGLVNEARVIPLPRATPPRR